MTEHDAPTVARATLWLDTSSETSTRRADSLEECATLAFERRSLEPAAPEAPPGTPAPGLRSAETMALDRASAFAAFEASATSTFATAQCPAATSQSNGGAGRWRSIVSHGVAMAVGAGALACVLALGRGDAPPRTKRAHERPAEQPPAKQAVAVSAARPASGPPQAQVPARTDGSAAIDGATDGTLSGAVEALARGDYAAAHALYAALAVQRPHDAALVAVATILADRIEARCASDGSKGTPCER
jgi:hypothetical protein